MDCDICSIYLHVPYLVIFFDILAKVVSDQFDEEVQSRCPAQFYLARSIVPSGEMRYVASSAHFMYTNKAVLRNRSE